jgi:RNA-directed DNA polymerase
MRTLYIEVLATYDGPEPCVGCPRGRRRSVGRGTRRRAIEPRQNEIGVPTLSYEAEGNIVGGVFASRSAGPAGSENQCMRGVSRCENREVPRSPACGDGRAGRAGKAQAVIP